MMADYLAFMALIGLLAGLIIRLRRRPARPTQSIASLTTGWAEVRGQARGGGDRFAPISGRQGLGWRVVVEQESGLGWVTIVDRSEFDNFEVEDATGTIRVRASDSPINLEVAELRGKGGPFSPPPASIERLIDGAVEMHGVMYHKGFRWREWVLEDGHEVVVRGRVISEVGDSSLGYRKLSEELVLAGGTARPLEVVD